MILHQDGSITYLTLVWNYPIDAAYSSIHFRSKLVSGEPSKWMVPICNYWSSSVHGTLFHWAAHKANGSSGIDKDSLEILRHKAEAMRLINERLGDREQQLKDETIVAVAYLANVEVCAVDV